jgi:succinate dehydrogenase/fumarate reductase flavoprotein subunit
MNETCDVVVIGGGSAGVAAAVAAARSGAKVILIERYGYLGGAGTASLVHTFCGLYRLDENVKTANPGLPTELPLRLIEYGVAQAPVKLGRVHVLPHHPMKLAAWYDCFTTETDGLRRLVPFRGCLRPSGCSAARGNRMRVSRSASDDRSIRIR